MFATIGYIIVFFFLLMAAIAALSAALSQDHDASAATALTSMALTFLACAFKYATGL